ncbi:MAG: hypothetical protein CMJ75_02655 [Planctomycetaceae bacterium]|nr:hypothetical protein [Planctomycetaceae bacterium]
MAVPQIALLVSSYERPGHLQRCLLSIACQRDVPGGFEVVVTDDGSTDETEQVVRDFARSVDFQVQFVTHLHNGFQLARCRNNGVKASQAPYLLFLDGDCLLPSDHVSWHVRQRRRHVVSAGDCCRLDQVTSEQINDSKIRDGSFVNTAPRAELRRMARQHRKAVLYNLIRHATKPKLIGNNIGIAREDYERVNGYDERFVGWGCEDDDLRLRLRQAGIRIQSVMNRTFTYHLWHPYVPSAALEWKAGPNVKYLQRQSRLTRCLSGMTHRKPEELATSLTGQPQSYGQVVEFLPQLTSQATVDTPDIEVLVLPGTGEFTGQADCQLLVVLDGTPIPARQLRRADAIVTDQLPPVPTAKPYFPLSQFQEAVRAVA